jgi:hypothetical protein
MHARSHAWGREKGFHTVLSNSVCERRGEVERKRRSDAGKIMTPEKRAAFREKLTMARTTTTTTTTTPPPPDEDTTDMETTTAGAADDDNNNINNNHAIARNAAMHEDTETTLEENQDMTIV